jgi:hypothetical protein
MIRMRHVRRVALLIVFCTLLFTPSASGQVGEEGLNPAETFWLGPYFAGLPLTDTRYQSFEYGQCKTFPGGEGACPSPVLVENTTSCFRNPIRSNSEAKEILSVRGDGIAVPSEEGVEVGTGRQTVNIRTVEPELLGAALRDVRRRSEPAPEPFAPPAYPLPVMRELKRVTVAEDRFDGIAEIAKATELGPDEVRMRLRIAELLGPDALADVPAPTMSTALVKRLSELAFGVQTHNLAHTAERHGMSVASLRKKIHRVRGLAGDC